MIELKVASQPELQYNEKKSKGIQYGCNNYSVISHILFVIMKDKCCSANKKADENRDQSVTEDDATYHTII